MNRIESFQATNQP